MAHVLADASNRGHCRRFSLQDRLDRDASADSPIAACPGPTSLSPEDPVFLLCPNAGPHLSFIWLPFQLLFYVTILYKPHQAYYHRGIIEAMETGNAIYSEAQPFEVMVRGPFAALLRVPDGGFTWNDGLVVFDDKQAKADTRSPWLVRPVGTRTVRQYAPLAVLDLHRRFSSA